MSQDLEKLARDVARHRGTDAEVQKAITNRVLQEVGQQGTTPIVDQSMICLDNAGNLIRIKTDKGPVYQVDGADQTPVASVFSAITLWVFQPQNCRCSYGSFVDTDSGPPCLVVAANPTMPGGATSRAAVNPDTPIPTPGGLTRGNGTWSGFQS